MNRKYYLAFGAIIIFLLGAGLWSKGYFTADSNPQLATTLEAGAADCVANNTELHEQGKCFYELAETVYDFYPPSAYEEYFQAGTDRRILSNCHEFMHYVGWKKYQETENMSQAFAEAVSVCNQGMYHGIVEEYIKNINYDTDLAIPKLLNEACQAVADRTEVGYNHMASLCFHGVGHGLMFVTNKDLPHSLDLCDSLPNQYIDSCYTGVYMENQSSKAVGDIVDHPSDYYDPNDLTYPCRILKPNQQEFCYLYEAVDLLNLYQNDSEAWFAACQEFPTEFRRTCYSGIGSNIPSPSLTARETEPMCEAALTYGLDAYQACLEGVIAAVSSHFDGAPAAFKDVCEETEPEAKNFCYQMSGELLKDWVGPETDLATLCQYFEEEEAIAICSGGI